MCGNKNMNYVQTAPLGDPLSLVLKGINVKKKLTWNSELYKKKQILHLRSISEWGL